MKSVWKLSLKDTYFILQNKYLRVYEDTFGTKILRDDCTYSTTQS